VLKKDETTVDLERERIGKEVTLGLASQLKQLMNREKGKDADFIILSGDPLSVYSHVLETYVDGKKVFDRSDPKDHLLAVGGFGASKDQEMHLDCYKDGD